MSVLIKGLKLPKDCAVKVAIRDGIASVYLDEGKADYYSVIELPDHGRLIDADKIEYYEVIRFGEPHYMVWKPHIDGLPTILEAERSEDERE